MFEYLFDRPAVPCTASKKPYPIASFHTNEFHNGDPS